MIQTQNTKRTIYLPIELWDKVDELAKTTTRSHWIQQAIRNRIKETKESHYES